jgi:nucleolar protein 6
MTQEDKSSVRKAKKAQRDAERRQLKGKKRKHDEVTEPEPLPPQDEDVEESTVAADAPPTDSTQKASSKKRKSGHVEAEGAVADASNTTAADDTTSRPKKKRRKGKSEEDKPSKNRFIVFVGNLPYKTTDSSLLKHFAKLQPFTLRHRTDPKTQKSKGFAFLEFENYDRMKTCLKIYHHSMFDPEALDRGEAPIDPEKPQPEQQSVDGRGRKKKETARKINVELTAGGGGNKAEGRKEKIKEKNVRLEEQRKRRAELERKEKEKERKEGGGKKKGVRKDGDHVNEVGAGQEAEETHGMHPARLAMIGR